MEELRYCKKCCSKKPLIEEFWHHRKTRKDGWELSCKSCLNVIKKKSYHKNKDTQKSYRNNFQSTHKEESKEYQKIYYINNSHKNKKRNQDKKEEIREYKRIRQNKKRKEDPIFNLKHSIGNMIYKSLKSNGYTKKSRSYKILGCEFEEFKQHIESLWESWMTWDNKGKYNGELNYGWDIDHIIPLSSVKTEEEILKLNHYTNLQPLCSHINRDIKRDKIEYLSETRI